MASFIDGMKNFELVHVRTLSSVTLYLARVAIVCILLFSVASKIRFKTLLLAGESLLANEFILYSAIGIEAFAIAFLVLARRWASWWGAVGLFSVFTPIALWSWITKTDCGCFGSTPLNWLSLPIDVDVLCALFVTRKYWRSSESDSLKLPDGSSWLNVAYSEMRQRQNVFAIVIGMAASMIGVGLAAIPANESVVGERIRYLLADELVGNNWPLRVAKYAAVSKTGKGKWLVLIVRKDCEHCRELVAKLAGVEWSSKSFGVLTMVAGSNAWPVLEGKIELEFTTSSTIDWGTDGEPFVASPAAFLIDDGTVVAAKDGEEAEQFVLGLRDEGMRNRE
ncbi:MAG: hypothetical protein SGI77_10630 [Pirellulaceae bacterium]|nr:hypothetical protein [Pirellulaceae bacterium]